MGHCSAIQMLLQGNKSSLSLGSTGTVKNVNLRILVSQAARSDLLQILAILWNEGSVLKQRANTNEPHR